MDQIIKELETRFGKSNWIAENRIKTFDGFYQMFVCDGKVVRVDVNHSGEISVNEGIKIESDAILTIDDIFSEVNDE